MAEQSKRMMYRVSVVGEQLDIALANLQARPHGAPGGCPLPPQPPPLPAPGP